jgi:hypothetical protein
MIACTQLAATISKHNKPRRGEMMDQNIAKQFIDFQKTSFENTFIAIAMMQDQAEKATKMFMETSTCAVPDEGKKMMNEWAQAFRKGREEFKKALDDSFRRMEGFFSGEKGKAQ